MGNTTSNEEESRIKSKSRRSSQRSTCFNSASSTCSKHTGSYNPGVLEPNNGKQHSNCQHHGILNRLKKKTSSRHSINGSTSKNCPRIDFFSRNNNGNSVDDGKQSTSFSSMYSSAYSIQNNEFDLIDKYTDSQMTLLNNNNNNSNSNNHNLQSLVGSAFYSNDSSTSFHSTSTSVSTIDTNRQHHQHHSHGDSNESILENDIYKSYSSELMLKELYMLSETSPERRRDRDR